MHGVAKASGQLCAVRVRQGSGAVAAPCCVARWAELFFEIFACVVTLGEEGVIAFRNVMLMQMRRRQSRGRVIKR